MKKPAIQPSDCHVVINDWENPNRFVGTATCFDASGKVLWAIDALCKGVNGPGFDRVGGDTPPGLYRAGVLTRTQRWEGPETWNAYGAYFIDLVEQESQESSRGRAGVGWHGGGTGAIPYPLADYQELRPTLGCIRARNKDMKEIIVPTYERVTRAGGVLWISVNQH